MYIGKLIFLVVGNCIKWIFHLGQKSFEDVSKEDNYWLGFAVVFIIILIFYSRVNSSNFVTLQF
jgi:hypothetical protein